MDRVTRHRMRKKRRRWLVLGTMLCLAVFIGGFIMTDLSLASMNDREAASSVVFSDISQRLKDAHIWDKLSDMADILQQRIKMIIP